MTNLTFLHRAVEADGTVHAARYAEDHARFTTACAAYPAPTVDHVESNVARPVTCPACITACQTSPDSLLTLLTDTH